MDIITDKYNKVTKCPHCESKFIYNEKDEKPLYPTDVLVQELDNKARKFNMDCELGTVHSTPASVVTCPCCGKMLLTRQMRIWYRK